VEAELIHLWRRQNERRRYARRRRSTVVEGRFTHEQFFSEPGISRYRPYTGIGPHREDDES
jgi:hypothetical protein